MQHISIVLLTSLMLSACGSDDSIEDGSAADNGSSPGGAEPGSGRTTHNVCRFNEEGDDLVPNGAIDEAESWVLVESMSQAAADIDIEAVPQDDQFLAAFASIAFIAPSLADAFSVLNSLYACTDAMYALNQCNWSDEFQETGTLSVATTFGSGQSYTATVSSKEDSASSFQQILQLEGTIGDIGNINFHMYEGGVLAGSRVATRTENGTETVRWTSDATNWVATETAGCGGSLEYSDIRDTETITVDANWTYGGSATSGSLDYSSVGDTTSSITLTW